MTIINNIINSFENYYVGTADIVTTLLIVAVVSLYEFFVYKFISHRAFYNKSFNISIAIMPFFLATIIMCLQSNLALVLGTIGALAIIRFRTAIKDPVDMLYLLWSIHTGITCGCSLYEVSILTSLAVTVVMFILDKLKFTHTTYTLTMNIDQDKVDDINEFLKQNTKNFEIKCRNYTQNSIDYVIDFNVKDIDAFTKLLNESKLTKKFSILVYDGEELI